MDFFCELPFNDWVLFLYNNMENLKQCNKCKKIKDICCFYKRKNRRIGTNSWCKDCYKKYYQDNKVEKEKYRKKYKLKNPEKIKESNKKWRENNIEYYKKYQKKHRQENPEYYKKYRQKNQKEIKKYKKKWKKENPEYYKKYQKNRCEIDTHFKLRKNISSLILIKLKRRLSSKNEKSTFTFLPYTINDLIKHIEKQFTKGMSWDNHGKWHIDHIKPDSLFNYKSVEDKEFQECWALENLQPLWAEDNLHKSNKY